MWRSVEYKSPFNAVIIDLEYTPEHKLEECDFRKFHYIELYVYYHWI